MHLLLLRFVILILLVDLLRLSLALLTLLQEERVGELHLLYQALNKRVEIASFLIVCETDIVYSVVEEKSRYLVFLTLGIYGYGCTALLLNEGHTGDICNSVAKVYHIAIGNYTIAHLVVYLLVLGFVVGSL